jgi:uncharacterized protein (DUF2336 family)
MPHNLQSEVNAVERHKAMPDDQDGVVKAHQALIDDLSAVAACGTIGSRAEILRRITDLFVSGCERFNHEQRALFDDVMSRLIAEIDSSARAAFGERLAAIPSAPSNVSRTLALDDLIEVAGPLLARSEQLDDETLVKSASTNSQEHLLAISRRKVINERVTDVLVERGNQQVAVSTAANSGARFSEFGYSTLVTRSEDDETLALTVWARPEIPREHLLALFSTASVAVRSSLEVADRAKAVLIRDMVKQAADRTQTKMREHYPGFLRAKAHVHQLFHSRALTEDRLREFAEAGQFDETVVALALLIDLPIGAIERTLVPDQDHGDQILLLARSINLSWETTRALLIMQSPNGSKNRSTLGVDHWLASYNKLKPATARTAIQFYRLRDRMTKATSI